MSDRILCKFFVHGSCLKGENCEYSHDSKHHANNVCTFYQKGICSYGTRCRYEHVRTEEREEHTKECEKKQRRIEALKRSQDIECSVCLDRVLSKATPGERKFGLLTECHHPFCIQCIRNWRSSAPVSGMDVNSTLRACPICRKLSYFVVPSVVWYSTPEEKKEIIDVYKAKLRSIDCKHFSFGNGNCPFGGSCFYKHAYSDGNLEEAVVRHLGSQEGETVIADTVAGLSEFLGRVHI